MHTIDYNAIDPYRPTVTLLSYRVTMPIQKAGKLFNIPLNCTVCTYKASLLLVKKSIVTVVDRVAIWANIIICF